MNTVKMRKKVKDVDMMQKEFDDKEKSLIDAGFLQMPYSSHLRTKYRGLWSSVGGAKKDLSVKNQGLRTFVLSLKMIRARRQPWY